MRLRRDVLALLATALIAAGVALVAVFVGHSHPFRHGAFIAGMALLAVGVLIFLPLVVDRPPPDPEHERQLRQMLLNARDAVEHERGYIYAEPRPKSELDHAMFRAHFPKIAKALLEWNRVAARDDEARIALPIRFAEEVRDRKLTELPYRPEVLANDLAGLTAQRARAGMLDRPLALELGLDSIWTGLLVPSPPADGLRVRQSLNWAVDMTGVTDGNYKKVADERVKPVNEMLEEAQSWPETLEVKAAREALHGYSRDPLLDALQTAIEQRRYEYARRCPECRIAR